MHFLNSKPYTLNSKYGFTLIELMIVMLLIGILATLGVGSFKSSRQKGNDISRKSDLGNIAKSLEAYYTDTGSYPRDDGGKMVACYYGATFPVACKWDGEWRDAAGTYYMALLPADRASGRMYFYDSDATGSFYQLYALLENLQDGDLARDGSGDVLYYSGTNCGGSLYCNYGVASANVQLSGNGHDQTEKKQ